MSLRGVLRGVLCGAVGALALPARASPIDDARLSVARSAGALSCPDDEVLAARVRALRQGNQAPPALLIDVLIERDQAGYRALVRVNGPRSGVRELHADGDSCGGLSDALSVSLALLLDEETLAPPPADPPPPASPPAPVAPRPPPPPPRPRPALLLGLAAGAAAGLPGSVPVVEGGLRLASPGPLRLGLRAAWSPAIRRPFSDGTVDVRLLRAAFDLCSRVAGGPRRELSPCATVSLGSLAGDGRGFTPDRSVSRLYYALGVGAVARGPLLPWLGWTARAGLLFSLTRERFVVDGQQGAAFGLPPAGAELTAGLEARVW